MEVPNMHFYQNGNYVLLLCLCSVKTHGSKKKMHSHQSQKIWNNIKNQFHKAFEIVKTFQKYLIKKSKKQVKNV